MGQDFVDSEPNVVQFSLLLPLPPRLVGAAVVTWVRLVLLRHGDDHVTFERFVALRDLDVELRVHGSCVWGEMYH